ncbi:MAG: formate/nitrite transporter family protein, partial [Methanocalculus sp. MSAO_Arc2]|uniref:formate/nitrite transporter family protein n=1 Tax=Methanocalculus sp. MSAO_Arc2 TaxID=2293855 RepID=UPI000FF00846
LGICADDAIGKIAGIWFPIMAFVSSGLEHSIANIYFLPAAIFIQGYASPEQMAVFANNAVQLNWVTMWTNNVIMVTIGNMIGAIFFVAIIYWVAFRKEMAALK